MEAACYPDVADLLVLGWKYNRSQNRGGPDQPLSSDFWPMEFGESRIYSFLSAANLGRLATIAWASGLSVFNGRQRICFV